MHYIISENFEIIKNGCTKAQKYTIVPVNSLNIEVDDIIIYPLKQHKASIKPLRQEVAHNKKDSE